MEKFIRIISLIVPLIGLLGGFAGADKKIRDDLEERREHEEHRKDMGRICGLVVGVLLTCGLILLIRRHEDEKKKLGFRI